VEDVLTAGELADTAARYKKLAGFEVEALNAREPIVPVTRAVT
jgi:5-methylphenazine-1-carboxylate 1-monooxygenase